MKIRFLIFSMFMLILIGCSRHGEISTAKLVVAGLGTDTPENLIILGYSDQGEFFSYMPKLDRRGFEIEIDTGEWTFYGLVHSGGNNSLCAFTREEIQSEREEVVLTFNQNNCNNSAITETGTFDSKNTFIPVKMQFCEDLDHVDGNICGAGNFAKVGSVQISIPTVQANELDERVSISGPYYDFACINLNDGNNLKNLNIPLGGNLRLPFPIEMFVYSDNDCQDDEEDFGFRRAFENHGGLESVSSIENDGTNDYYNIFFSDPYAVDHGGGGGGGEINVTLNSREGEITDEVDYHGLTSSSLYGNKYLEYMFDTDLESNIAHTNNSNNEDPEWIQIGFMLERELSEVKFYNRPTQAHRLRDINVQVFDEDNNIKYDYKQVTGSLWNPGNNLGGPAFLSIDFTSDDTTKGGVGGMVTGKYIRVTRYFKNSQGQSHGVNIHDRNLTIARAQIWGKTYNLIPKEFYIDRQDLENRTPYPEIIMSGVREWDLIEYYNSSDCSGFPIAYGHWDPENQVHRAIPYDEVGFNNQDLTYIIRSEENFVSECSSSVNINKKITYQAQPNFGPWYFHSHYTDFIYNSSASPGEDVENTAVNMNDYSIDTYFATSGNDGNFHRVRITPTGELKPIIGLLIQMLPDDHIEADLNAEISDLNIITYNSDNQEIFNFETVNGRLFNPSDKSVMTPDEINFEIQEGQIVAEWDSGTYFNTNIAYLDIIRKDANKSKLVIPEISFRVIEPDVRVMKAVRVGDLTRNTYPTFSIKNTLTSDRIQLFNAECEKPLSVKYNGAAPNTSVVANQNIVEGQNNIWIKTQDNGPCINTSKFFIYDTTAPSEFSLQTTAVEGTSPNPGFVAELKNYETIGGANLYADSNCSSIVSTMVREDSGEFVFSSVETQAQEGGVDYYAKTFDLVQNYSDCHKVLTYNLVDQDIISQTEPQNGASSDGNWPQHQMSYALDDGLNTTAITKAINPWNTTKDGVISDPKHQNNQYIDFTFNQTVDFAGVEIRSRNDCCQDRFRDLDILILDDSDNVVYRYYDEANQLFNPDNMFGFISQGSSLKYFRVDFTREESLLGGNGGVVSGNKLRIIRYPKYIVGNEKDYALEVSRVKIFTKD